MIFDIDISACTRRDDDENAVGKLEMKRAMISTGVRWLSAARKPIKMPSGTPSQRRPRNRARATDLACSTSGLCTTNIAFSTARTRCSSPVSIRRRAPLGSASSPEPVLCRLRRRGGSSAPMPAACLLTPVDDAEPPLEQEPPTPGFAMACLRNSAMTASASSSSTPKDSCSHLSMTRYEAQPMKAPVTVADISMSPDLPDITSISACA
mmetsp:Transcript_88940/g.154049  ORF Transcript_88940/g.154049 Transcript_88940/m.154049 type:complete len:209 (+) Transcript_88940:162-788(+)